MKKNSPIIATLAENLRHYRLQRGLSQEEFADICGLHRTYIGSVERCERNITLMTLETLANGLEVSIFDLLSPRS